MGQKKAVGDQDRENLTEKDKMEKLRKKDIYMWKLKECIRPIKRIIKEHDVYSQKNLFADKSDMNVDPFSRSHIPKKQNWCGLRL